MDVREAANKVRLTNTSLPYDCRKSTHNSSQSNKRNSSSQDKTGKVSPASVKKSTGSPHPPPPPTLAVVATHTPEEQVSI